MFIAFDPASKEGDYSCTITVRKNKKGEIIVMEKPKGAIFSEYSVDEVSEEDHKKLLLCYPKGYRRAYFKKWLKEDKIKKMKLFRTFDVLLSEKVYIVQGDKTEQTAKVTMNVFQGHWCLKEVKFTTFKNPYSRSDWRFLGDLAIYVEYLCIKSGADKLNMEIPKEIDYQELSRK